VGTPTGGTPQGDELQEVTVTVTTRRIPVVCLSPAGAGPNPVERRVGIATGGIPIYVYEPRPDAIFLFVSTTAFVMLTLPFTTQAFAICKGRDEKFELRPDQLRARRCSFVWIVRGGSRRQRVRCLRSLVRASA
jgi:hypothetical protein